MVKEFSVSTITLFYLTLGQFSALAQTKADLQINEDQKQLMRSFRDASAQKEIQKRNELFVKIKNDQKLVDYMKEEEPGYFALYRMVRISVEKGY